MLKNILKLKGVEVLTKNQQKAINGGFIQCPADGNCGARYCCKQGLCKPGACLPTFP